MMNVYLGFDVGSTFTKICVLDENGAIISLSSFSTPAVQKEGLLEHFKRLSIDYHVLAGASCGYGRNNVSLDITVPELVALAKGIFCIQPEVHTVIDIGGQDAKVIHCSNGKLTRFLLNDKCAAGSGLFLQNVLRITGLNFDSLVAKVEPTELLSTTCAVFAQTEIIRLIAQGRPLQQLIASVLFSIMRQAAILLKKVGVEPQLAFTGGLSLIPGIGDMLLSIVKSPVTIPVHSTFLAAIGCATIAQEKDRMDGRNILLNSYIERKDN